MNESYIKFKCDWVNKRIYYNIAEINKWRNKLYKLGLIGTYDNKVGFGNISVRFENTSQFIITGSGTGKLEKLNENHYTKVIDFNFDKNYLKCEGQIKASSESLTHAAVYNSDNKANAVIHVHNLELWNKLKDKVQDKIPATSEKAAYGTPEMAHEVIRLFKETDVKDKRIFVMLGHEEGIVAFGKDLEEAGTILLNSFLSP